MNRQALAACVRSLVAGGKGLLAAYGRAPPAIRKVAHNYNRL